MARIEPQLAYADHATVKRATRTCRRCHGTGIVIDPHWDMHTEPIASGETPCPDCQPVRTLPPMTAEEAAALDAELEGIPL